MEEALKQLCSDVEEAVRGGLEIVVLSDRIGTEDMDIETPPIPTLLAVGAVHHHLIRCASAPFTGRRCLVHWHQANLTAINLSHWPSARNCLYMHLTERRHALILFSVLTVWLQGLCCLPQ